MALRLTTAATAPCCSRRHAQEKARPTILDWGTDSIWSLDNPRPRRGRRERCLVSSALPETAVSVIVTAVAVGAAATFLRRIPEASPNKDSSFATCEDCGGSGICSECKGEGFVLKKLTDENAEKARLTAKNMATRYTAGLPRKWTYCNKCSASRSCTACKGSGKILL